MEPNLAESASVIDFDQETTIIRPTTFGARTAAYKSCV